MERRPAESAPLPALRALALALLAVIAGDLWNGRWAAQAGLLLARRAPGVPQAPPWLLAPEWTLLAAAALLLWRGRRLAGARLAAATLAFSVLQSAMNTKLTLLLVLAGLCVPGEDGLVLARWQPLLVYAFSALNKWRAGFQSGASLLALAGNLAGMRNGPLVPPAATLAVLSLPGAAAAASWAVILLEGAGLPAALLLRPRLGIALVAAFHLLLALTMPDLWAFGLTMTGAALLFA